MAQSLKRRAKRFRLTPGLYKNIASFAKRKRTSISRVIQGSFKVNRQRYSKALKRARKNNTTLYKELGLSANKARSRVSAFKKTFKAKPRKRKITRRTKSTRTTNLETQLSAVKKELVTVQNQYKQSSEQATSLLNEAQGLKSQISTLEKTLFKTQKDLNKKYGAERGRSIAKDRTIFALNDQITSLKTEIAKKQSRLTEVGSQLGRLTVLKNKLDKKVLRLEDELQKMAEQLKDSNSRKDELIAQGQNLQNEINRLQREINRYEGNQQQFNAQLVALQEELSRVDNALQSIHGNTRADKINHINKQLKTAVDSLVLCDKNSEECENKLTRSTQFIEKLLKTVPKGARNKTLLKIKRMLNQYKSGLPLSEMRKRRRR